MAIYWVFIPIAKEIEIKQLLSRQSNTVKWLRNEGLGFLIPMFYCKGLATVTSIVIANTTQRKETIIRPKECMKEMKLSVTGDKLSISAVVQTNR